MPGTWDSATLCHLIRGPRWPKSMGFDRCLGWARQLAHRWRATRPNAELSLKPPPPNSSLLHLSRFSPKSNDPVLIHACSLPRSRRVLSGSCSCDRELLLLSCQHGHDGESHRARGGQWGDTLDVPFPLWCGLPMSLRVLLHSGCRMHWSRAEL
jgi:hypothetical protein